MQNIQIETVSTNVKDFCSGVIDDQLAVLTVPVQQLNVLAVYVPSTDSIYFTAESVLKALGFSDTRIKSIKKKMLNDALTGKGVRQFSTRNGDTELAVNVKHLGMWLGGLRLTPKVRKNVPDIEKRITVLATEGENASRAIFGLNGKSPKPPDYTQEKIAYNRLMASGCSYDLKQTSKILNYRGRNRLARFLRDQGIFLQGSPPEPYEHYVDHDYFEVAYDSHQPQAFVTLVKPKGLDLIRQLIEEEKQKQLSPRC